MLNAFREESRNELCKNGCFKLHENSVHYNTKAGGQVVQRNITFSAEEELIKKARKKAQKENTTLNAEFREWLKRYIGADKHLVNFESLMESLRYADSGGGSYSRDEMNER
jgi:tryptophan synthase beta subunit